MVMRMGILAVYPRVAIDTEVASWFHARLGGEWGTAMQAVSFAGSGGVMFVCLVSAGVFLALGGRWGVVMFVCLVSGVLYLAWRRRWGGLATLVVTVPCGILLGEGLKLLVQRQRPYLVGPYVDWSGYSFPSGHAISATLFYGLLCVW